MDARTWSTAGSLHRTIAPSSSSSSSSQTNHRSAELCSDGDAVQRFTTAPTHKSPPAYGEGLSQYLLEVSERIGLSCSTDSNSVKEEAEEVRAPLKRLRRLYLGDAPCTPSSATTTVTTSTTTAAAAAASTTTCTSTAASISTTPDVALTTSSSATTTRPRLWLGPTSYAPEAKEEEDHHNTSSTATSPSIVSPAQPPTLRSIFLDADQATYEALCTVGLSTLMPAMASTTSTSLTVPSSGDVDARLDLLEEVKLCNIVPLLPRTFAWRSLVQQVVPCTAVGAPTTTTTTASSDASVCGGHCSGHVRAAQAAHREHLLHLSVLPSPGTSSTSTSTTGATTTTTTTNNNTGDEASVPPASAADIPPWERLWGSETRGVMVEWCSGGVGYTTDVDGLLEEQRRRAERTYYFPMTSYHARGHHHHQQQQQEVVGAKRPRSMMDLDLHQPPHTLRGATLLQLWSAKEFADEKMDLQHHNTRDASSSTMEMKTEEEKGSTYSTVLAAPQQHQHHHQICCGCHHCQPWSARYAHVALQCVDLQAYLHELHRRGDANTNTKYHEDDDDDDEVQWLGNIARRTRAVEVCALEECVLVCLAPENQPYRAELLPPMEAFIRLLSCRLAPRVEMAMEACADVRGTRLAEAVAEELHTTPESLHASTNFMMSEMNVSLPPHNPVAARRRYRQQMRASVQQHVVGGDGMSSTLHSCATRAWEHLCSSIPLLAHDDEEAKKERPTKVLLLDDDDDDGQDAGNEDEDENDLATRLAKMHADDALNSAAEEVVGVVVEALRHVLYRRIMVMYELLRWLATRFAMGRSNRELMLRYRQWYAETPSPAAVLRLLHKSACFQSAMVRRFPRYFSFLADEATTPPQSPMTPPSYTSSKHHHHHYHSRRGFASANTTSGELSDEMDHHAFVPESALLEECYWSRFAEWAARGSSTTHSPHHLALAPAPPPTMYASPLPHAAQLPSPTFSSASHRSPTLGGGDASPTSTDTSSPHSPASTTTPSSSAYATQHHSAAVDATLRVVMRSLQHDGRTMSLDEIDHHSRLPQRITE